MSYEEALKILTTNEYDFGCGDCTWGAGQPKECENTECDYKKAIEVAIEALEIVEKLRIIMLNCNILKGE